MRSGAVKRTCVHAMEHDDVSADSPLPQSAGATNVLGSYRRRRSKSVIRTLAGNHPSCSMRIDALTLAWVPPIGVTRPIAAAEEWLTTVNTSPAARFTTD